MKRVILAFLAQLTVFAASAQIPVMNPITGTSAFCSVPGSVSYTTSASNSPTSYNWSIIPSSGVVMSGSTGAVVSITFPQTTTTYTLYCYAINSSGQSTPVSKIINVFESPSVTFSGSGNTFCQGSSAFLMASPTTQASSSTLSYIWFPSYGLSSTNSYSVIANPTVSTNYTVSVGLGPCTSTYAIAITVLSPPLLSISTTHAQLCAGQTATVTASGTSMSYYVNNQLSPSSFTIAPAGTTTYVIKGIGQNGCETQQNFVQNVVASPVIVVSSLPNPLCEGQTSTINISGSPANYSVNSVASPASFTMSPSVTSTLVINAENSNACNSSTDHVLTVKPSPSLNVNSTSNPMCKNEVHTITITGNAVTYHVNSLASPSSFTISPAGTTTYVVQGTGQNGCATQMTFIQNVSLCLGLQKAENLINYLNVYPNPSSGQFTIKAGINTEAKIYDQLGRQVHTLTLKKDEETPLSGFAEGLYSIVTESQTIKLIISK